MSAIGSEVDLYRLAERGSVSCFKCGKTSHSSKDCPKEFSDFTTMYNSLMEDVDAIIDKLKGTGKYSEDEFGLVEKTGEIFDFSENWSNNVFCLNCGEPGHDHTKCPHEKQFSTRSPVYKSASTDGIAKFFADEMQ